MPVVPAVTSAEGPLIAAYQTAWERVLAEQQTLINDPIRATRAKRLAEMRAVIEDTMDEISATSRQWIAQRLPQVYATGGVVGAAPMGAGEFLWTAISQEAVEELAGQMFQEVLAATTHVNDTTKALVRKIAQSEALQKAIEGRTAVQAGREMARLIADNGIHAIVYANGAKHGLAEYGEMVARTTTAKAYNYGVLNGAAQKGCQFWEVFDGPQCGWSAHDSGEMALGKIVTRDEALAFPISHPNCRRTFGPRPDLNSTAQAGEGKGQVTPEQVAAQRLQDQERAARQSRRALRNRQTAERRAARTPRSRVEKRASRLSGRTPEAAPAAPSAPERLVTREGKPFNPVITKMVDEGYDTREILARFQRGIGGGTPGVDFDSPLGVALRQQIADYKHLRKAQQTLPTTPPVVQAATPPKPKPFNPTGKPPSYATFSLAEQKALYDYAWDFESYNDFNWPLRLGTDFREGVPERIDYLTDLIDTHRIDTDVVVHRLLSVDDEYAELAQRFQPGQVFEEKGFMSTALDKGKAEEFDQLEHSILLDIEAPAGTPAVHVGSSIESYANTLEYSAFYDQTEVLFQRGTQLEVLEAVEVETQFGGKQLQVRARVVPLADKPGSLT